MCEYMYMNYERWCCLYTCDVLSLRTCTKVTRLKALSYSCVKRNNQYVH